MLLPQHSHLLCVQLNDVVLVEVQVEWRDHLPLVDVVQRDPAFDQILYVAEERLKVQDVHLLRSQPVLAADARGCRCLPSKEAWPVVLANRVRVRNFKEISLD